MRPLEILLMLANLATFFILAIPQLRAVRWTQYSALIGVVITGLQTLVEGPRWQMVPPNNFLRWSWKRAGLSSLYLSVSRQLFLPF